MENFEKHLTFYHPKNATLNAINAGINNAFPAFILLCSFHFNDNPVWLIASTNIITSDMPINQWSFDQIAGKLWEAIQNNTHCAENSTLSTSQTALNATADNTVPGQYNGLMSPKKQQSSKTDVAQTFYITHLGLSAGLD